MNPVGRQSQGKLFTIFWLIRRAGAMMEECLEEHEIQWCCNWAGHGNGFVVEGANCVHEHGGHGDHAGGVSHTGLLWS